MSASLCLLFAAWFDWVCVVVGVDVIEADCEIVDEEDVGFMFDGLKTSDPDKNV